MHSSRVLSLIALALGTLFVVGLTGCSLYSPKSYGNSGYYSGRGYGRLSGAAYNCGYFSNSSCGYLGAYSGGYHYGYRHLHSGWDDGFHGHFSSPHHMDNSWLSPTFGLSTYGRHDGLTHEYLGTPGSRDFGSWRLNHRQRGHRASSAGRLGGRGSGHSRSTQHGATHRASAGQPRTGHTRAAPRSSTPHSAPGHRSGTGSHAGRHH